MSIYYFVGGSKGNWQVTDMQTIKGQELKPIQNLMITTNFNEAPLEQAWVLRGISSNIRYSNRSEVDELKSKQSNLGRNEATSAVLIPMSKSEAWWNMAQDERRRLFEETSHHIQIGIKYLPAVARKLYHSRDLGEPFDFITWFEFEPKYKEAFNLLLIELRSTEEWKYVNREVEIHLSSYL